ncbi:hypothetical protein DV735_g3728, partial [Chaetothyriales sp. CBS 134920]
MFAVLAQKEPEGQALPPGERNGLATATGYSNQPTATRRLESACSLSFSSATSYLQILLPLLSCLVSALAILTQWRLDRNRQPAEARHLQSSNQALIEIAEDDEQDSALDADRISVLNLQKTASHTRNSFVGINSPNGETVRASVECIALLGQVVLSAVTAVLSSTSAPTIPLPAAVAGLVVWVYIAALAAFRLLLSRTAWQLPFARLWNHTACLYGAQWLFEVWVFRSVLLRSPSKLVRDLVIAQFCLTTVLLAIAVTSRTGNHAVLLEYEGGIEPSREPLASPLSHALFAWVDPIVWAGYKKPLEMSQVWNVTLKDKAESALAHFRQVKKAHSLAWRLLIHFQSQILIQGAWCVLASIFMFLPTLLLKAILEFLEDQANIPVTAAWLYVILLFVTGCIQAIADGQALWIGRKICIRLRAIIIGEIYSKTLRRKAAATAHTVLAKPEEPVKKPLLKRLTTLFTRPSTKQASKLPPPPDSASRSDVQASNGTIINLMSIDSFKVAEICAYLHYLWAAVPVQLVMAVILLFQVLGLSSLAGIGLMILVLPLNLYVAKSFQSTQKRIMAATDKRIHATNEVLENIRIIKYFAWEQRFADKVNEKRKTELSALWKKYILWSLAATVWSAVPILITFVSFFIFTVVEKKPLVPSVAFPALSMFSLLRIPLDQLADMVAHVQESKVSVDRVEEFLNEEETEKYEQLRMSKHDNLAEPRIALENATMTWGSKSAELAATDAFRLINVNVDFQLGKLNIIAGPTGSGKTSLLMALLGEMKLVSGTVHLPGGSIRQQLRPDPLTGLTESVAYCAQQPWLINATIKENILFASLLDHQRYHAVISACALERDLAILDAGDQTLVGEKGITLSGGQKQRISLARAIYSNSKYLLLDDCLSAVDSHTAKHIFEQAITGSLMHQRTCILVSHNVALAVADASYIVVMNNGQVIAKGTPDEVIETGALGDELLKSRPPSAKASKAPSRVNSSQGLNAAALANGFVSSATTRPQADHGQETSNEGKKVVDPRTETMAIGRVKGTTIKMYLLSMGPWYYWIFAATAFVATQAGSVATNVWIREWANAYHITTSSTSSFIDGLSRFGTYTTTQVFGLKANSMPSIHSSGVAVPLTTTFPYNVDVGYYLGVYALIGIAYILICLSRELVLFGGSLHASFKIHNDLLHSVLRATFRFFDSTPLGQMTNRFSKDIQAIDQEVAPVAIGMIHSAASVATIVVLISVITPGFLIPGFFISLIYVGTSLIYIRSSRDLKRIEAVQRSPLFQHFGETLTGVVTIRAYGDEARFLQDSHLRVNTHNRPFIYLWATNRWLAVRMDIAGALVSFFSGTFVVLNARTLDAGAAGLALSYAITFTQNVLWLVRLYAANEQNMNAVERVQEYINIDQEAPARIAETAPAPNWPAEGVVEFVDYGTRYRPDLEPVLKNINIKIDAGSKLGVVGRTGAGKSSLALALFRGLEAETGKIAIDGADISKIGLQNLREAITIVPQDPTLFSGTLRNNLDPFELYTDEEIFTALRRVQLISGFPSKSGSATPDSTNTTPTIVGPPPGDQGGLDSIPGTASSNSTLAQGESTKGNKNIFLNLSTPIAESGSNLSQGQRQLLCLARALLKSPKVLVMDEATASIDYATDTSIQTTLRELKNHTLITIAHRLQTIIDYDMILVLDRGEVVEYDSPWNLIRKEKGSFRSMCETSGQFETLFELAKKVWEAERLVDDS